MQKSITAEIKHSVDLWVPVSRRVWGWILVSAFLEILMAYVFGFFVGQETVMLFLMAILFICISLIMSIIGSIVVNQAAWDEENKTRTPLMESLGRNFKYMTIESLRALLPVMLGALLIIPGIYFLVSYWWVVYVVQFDPEYKEGKIDALKRCRQLVKGRFFRAFGMLILYCALSMLSMFFGNENELMQNPLKLGLSVFVSVAAQIWGSILLYRFYMRIKDNLHA